LNNLSVIKLKLNRYFICVLGVIRQEPILRTCRFLDFLSLVLLAECHGAQAEVQMP